MNLHGIVSGQIAAVNPFNTVVISESIGQKQNPDGSRTPLYNSFPVQAQIQALTGKDLRALDGLNLQGTMRGVYFYGDVEAIIRSLKKGGDLFTDSDNRVWLVTQVLETWDNSDWCKIACTLQNGQ